MDCWRTQRAGAAFKEMGAAAAPRTAPRQGISADEPLVRVSLPDEPATALGHAADKPGFVEKGVGVWQRWVAAADGCGRSAPLARTAPVSSCRKLIGEPLTVPDESTSLIDAPAPLLGTLEIRRINSSLKQCSSPRPWRGVSAGVTCTDWYTTTSRPCRT